MTISYKWLSEYLPATVSPERLAHILTSVGLEVESTEHYEEFKGGLKGLIIGEVLTVMQHPNADKLKLTTVNIGRSEPLHIVCGAPNVAVRQKVVVAPVGATIYPLKQPPMTMKLAKIRGEESEGMICAEDEIGMGSAHEGIMVLPQEAKPGTAASVYFDIYTDTLFEIGLTPNRMDAMSHWGVARDICAYLTHHDKKEIKPKIPENRDFKAPKNKFPLKVRVENTQACPRYSGICIGNVTVAPSPSWLQHKLKAIGVKPINNLVDITNFIQHETGQPLHAFDFDKIRGGEVIVKNLPDGTTFVTLDEKERKLSAEDLMICDAEDGMCIGGVFGGLKSGVTQTTKNIFLESAFFDPVSIRKTSFRHGLRTDAASRFEKGTDISATVTVLKRAATLIREICGGDLTSDIYDIYPDPEPKKEVLLKYHYLKKLSGKNYHPDAVKNILSSLGFTIEKDGLDSLLLAVPYHKPDVALAADVVEEILRIDGLDNVEIPSTISITPAMDKTLELQRLKEKTANYLAGLGFYEIMTNSITNSAYFDEGELKETVKMKNSLSADLNIMRPNMLETGLEVIAYNLNRKNEDLKFFEFGKTYRVTNKGKFEEPNHLSLYLTGRLLPDSWKSTSNAVDFFTLKGIVEKVFHSVGAVNFSYGEVQSGQFGYGLSVKLGTQVVGQLGEVSPAVQKRFNIKQTVFFADLQWDLIMKTASKFKTVFRPVSRFPSVHRDIAMVVPRQLKYQLVTDLVQKLNLKKLQSVHLFDIFESDKIGKDKKSLAVNFTFRDEEKTLTDVEIDGWMQKIMDTLERDLEVEIRKQ